MVGKNADAYKRKKIEVIVIWLFKKTLFSFRIKSVDKQRNQE